MRRFAFRMTLRDILVTFLILVTVAVIVEKISLNHGELDMAKQDIQLTIVLEQDQGFVSNTLEVGDPVYQKGSIMPLGYISHIEILPAEFVLSDKYGETFIREVPMLKDTRITLDSVGFISIDGRTVIDNNIFYLNQYLPVTTNDTTFSTRVIDIIY